MFPAQLMDDTPIQVFIDNLEQHLPFSQLVVTTNIQYCKNTQKQRVLHPSTQEEAQLSHILDRTTTKIRKSDHPNQSISL